MIVYHGTPFGGDAAGVTRFLKGRHALIPFSNTSDCETAFEVCQTVVFDNGAFTAWKQGKPITDWRGYYKLFVSGIAIRRSRGRLSRT